MNKDLIANNSINYTEKAQPCHISVQFIDVANVYDIGEDTKHIPSIDETKKN
jgi:hypothetical protein